MSQSAVSSKVNWAGGRERQTDGTLTHLGGLNLGSPLRYASVLPSDGQPLNVYGQGVFQINPPAVSNALYTQGGLQLLTQTPAPPSIGFHESGHSALALYKSQANQLRVRTHDGADYALAGPPGTAWALIGEYFNGNGAQIPSINVWYEMIGVNATCTQGARVRLEATGTINFSGGQTVHIGPGIDGTVQHSLWVYTFPSNMVVTYHFVWYPTSYTAGLRRWGVFMNSSAGTGGLWSGAVQAFYISEQRC